MSKKKNYWFKHEYNANLSRRMVLLRLKWGSYEAVGLYWAVIEIIYASSNCYPFALAEDKQVLSKCLDVDLELLERFFACCFACDLLEIRDGNLWSRKVSEELGYEQELSKKRAISGRKGGKQTQTKCKANANQLVNFAKALRIDKIREDKIRIEDSNSLENNSLDNSLTTTSLPATTSEASTTKKPAPAETMPDGSPAHLSPTKDPKECLRENPNGQSVWMTDKQFRDLCDTWGDPMEIANQLDAMREYFSKLTPKQYRDYKDHRKTAINWRKRKHQDGYSWFTHPRTGPGYYKNWEIDRVQKQEAAA
jgi:hypothetical protein